MAGSRCRPGALGSPGGGPDRRAARRCARWRPAGRGPWPRRRCPARLVPVPARRRPTRQGPEAADGHDDRRGAGRGRLGGRLGAGRGRGHVPRPGPDQHAERPQEPCLVRPAGRAGRRRAPGAHGPGPRPARADRRGLRRDPGRRPRLGPPTPAGRAVVAPAGRSPARGVRRQGHHVRHRRRLHQDPRRHEAHGQGHGRCGGRHGGTIGAAALRLPVRVTALAPLAENMPGADAYRPGDVVRHYGGMTSEIANTDAEGRVVLADALSYAVRRLHPDLLVDLATLTGSATVALGKRTAALFTDSDPLAKALGEAADAAGERLWRMPLPDDYTEAVRGELADMVNSTDVGAGAVMAALYLREFVGAATDRWAHLDMSAPAWSDSADGELVKGATGWGVRTLLRWLQSLCPP